MKIMQTVICNRLVYSNLRNYTTGMTRKPVKVQIKQGIIVGEEKTLPNKNVYHRFLGIPYAVPPLGELRFKSPVPLDTFGVPELSCLMEGDVSHQRDPMTSEVVGSEDCLFLNVYVPKNAKNVHSLPVMVWIHGGGFQFGNGNSDYFLPLSLLQEDVIVVTLNYRLGALGFLCLPEEGIWGNAGLKDQRLALQWIQDNIEVFNGDPKNITLFGESAGAASVHLHVLSKHANVLFHKAIMQSGTANMEWIFQSNPVLKTKRLAELMGFKGSNTINLLKFLQSPEIKPSDILNKSLLVMTEDERRRCMPFPFTPVVEDRNSPDSFIKQLLWNRLKQPNSIEIPTIMGYNSAEGLAMMSFAMKRLKVYEQDFERLVPRNIPLEPESDKIKAIAKKIRCFYMNGQPITPENLNSLTNILSDFHFVVDMQKAAEWHVKLNPRTPLYFYRFDYVGERNMYKRILQLNKLAGACHGDELFYIFQMAGGDNTVCERDRKLTAQLSNLWANFAKCGNPTGGGLPKYINCDWTHVKKSNDGDFILDYLAIDNNGIQMKTNPDQERMEFWKNIYTTYKPQDLSALSSKL